MNKKYQVFVSSTFTDLEQERQACVEAILTAGHIPAGMELFSAGSESQLEIVKRWIDESDIYMLLLGGRYGSVEPKSGLSYTEIEYQHALDTGKPIFALVMEEEYLNEKVRTVGKDVLELNNPQKLSEFRKLVLSKISKFFKNEDQLKLGILQSLMDIQNRHKLNGWVKANDTVDSSKVLTELTELNEKNRQLEQEIVLLRAAIEPKSDEIAEKLTEDAKEILKEMKDEGSGELIAGSSTGRFAVFLGRQIFPTDQNPRKRALWEAAVEELKEQGLLSFRIDTSVGNKYSLSKTGYEVMDELFATN